MKRLVLFTSLVLGLMLLGVRYRAAVTAQASNPARPASVSATRMEHAAQEAGNWMSYGRTYNEQRFSPLKLINDQNISRLKLAWSYDLDTNRGQEATPLVIDGAMYFTSAWSKVFALNAATGKLIWSYDPQVPGEWAINACCDVVNRGVAAWQGKIIVGTLDGRLIVLDAATGKKVWETLTIDRNSRYTITGAPRVAQGKIIIGNGGAEFGVRGYVSAYDAETGKLIWRFYTVPGDPAKGFETPELAKAAETWSGKWWTLGGGGTVWNALTYDPDLDLLYIGTGNGTTWAEKYRSPEGGDNLFTCSIIAIKLSTGKYVWHYQQDPGDEWDFDSDEDIILADLTVAGVPRKVLMQAAKNGFFYVIDRTTGQLISAKPFTNVTWATGIDMKTGRPIESATARYSKDDPTPIVPGPLGAHSWQPMSYSPLTSLAYVPVNDAGFAYQTTNSFEAKQLAFNHAIDGVAAGMPQDPKVKKAILDSVKGKLVAWDPVRQKQAWVVERPGPWNGGVLSTAGNLVLEGTAAGNFEAYRASTGEKLWSSPAQTGVMAGPMTYSVDGEQYIAVLAGWGGVFPLAAGEVSFKSGRVRNISRMLVYKLEGKAALPALRDAEPAVLRPPSSKAGADDIKRGEAIFQRFCSNCHGDVAVSGGVIPDLRYSSALSSDQLFSSVVLGGLLRKQGMVSFAKELTGGDVNAIRSYVIFRANQSLGQGISVANGKK
jgi:quinohemoprotein ethanol dehydrogenase